MKFIGHFFLLVFSLNSCSKSGSSACKFETATLNGKKFKLTKVVKLSDNSNVTASVLSDPCSNSILTFTASNVELSYGNGCTDPKSTTSYSVRIGNGKNYMTINSSEQEILNFDCSSFSFDDLSDPDLPLRYTFTIF